MSGTSPHSFPHAASDRLQLELDILASETGRPAETDAGGAGANGRDGFTVLVADDDPDMRAYVRRCLRQARERPITRIFEAADGKAALALARRGGLDLIISGAATPGLDGLALCRALRSDDALRDLPVLLITGKPVPEVEAEPARGVLGKPFNARKVHEQLRRLLPDPAGRSPPAPDLPPTP